MNCLLELPVKPHVHKYLLAKYPEKYRLTLSDHIGNLLYHMLRRQEVDQREDNRLQKYTKRFVVEIDQFKLFKKGCKNLSSKTITRFGAFLEDMIESEFHSHVEMLESFGFQQKAAIESFMHKYNFEDSDINYDTLKKSYQRYREEQKSLGRGQIKGIAFVPFIYCLQNLGNPLRKLVKS